MPYYQTSMGKVAYETQGEGPPLLLLHATLHDRHDFDAIVPALARNHRVTALDWPAHGQSEVPVAPVTAVGLADVLEEIVVARDSHDLRLIGNSVGGFAAARLAIRHPERVARLVLVNSGGFQSANPFSRVYCRRVMGAPVLTRRIMPAFVRAYMRPQSALDEVITRCVSGRARTADGVALASSMWRSFADDGHDLRAHASELTSHTLLAWGRKDRAVPLNVGRATHQAICGSQLELFDTGHVPFSSQPEAFLRVVEPFLLQPVADSSPVTAAESA